MNLSIFLSALPFFHEIMKYTDNHGRIFIVTKSDLTTSIVCIGRIAKLFTIKIE